MDSNRHAEIGANRAATEIFLGHGSDAIQRVEAFIQSGGFSPHRHDVYAIGVTLSGVQAFRYRGADRQCLPGQCHILHPDEMHDGRAAESGGFRYRIAYIDPGIIQRALGGKSLPFVADPVLTPTPAQERLLAPLWDLANAIDSMREAEIAAAVADALEALQSRRPRRGKPLDIERLVRVRDLIATAPTAPYTAEELERVAGLDRWTLARQFRSAFGTSPSRFRTMRQLDNARRLMRRDLSLSEIALRAGFFDQSHMSRKFKRAYGLSPGMWLASLPSPAS